MSALELHDAGPLPASVPPARDATGELICQFRVPGLVVGRQQPMRIQHKQTGKWLFVTPDKTRNYQKILRDMALISMRNRPPVDFPVSMDIIAYMPIPKTMPKRDRDAALRGDIRPNVKPDWDNIGKNGDAFKGVVWLDDKQVADSRVRKFYSLVPGLVVTIRAFKAMELFG